MLFTPNATSLPRTPPPRSLSPAASLYSSYSYYPFDGSLSRSTSSSPAPSPAVQQQHINAGPQNTRAPESINDLSSQGPQTPQEYLQLGIQCHEANKLEDSARHFEKSANENGGCGIGMLMWGLTLRHGWGCPKDEKRGFKWLRQAAENAVDDLENARIGSSLDPQAIQTELVLAIYEVGQCFFQGWGVPKDQKMAVSYYQVAARLGDPDAQTDLAFCLANGKGCKKDRKEAAKWYRAAVAQGQSDIGLAWIYKEKYQ
ncbi:HCP-like protein [Amanita rubescens]|nr:HCP-like protein [Amanita rubescens]